MIKIISELLICNFTACRLLSVSCLSRFVWGKITQYSSLVWMQCCVLCWYFILYCMGHVLYLVEVYCSNLFGGVWSYPAYDKALSKIWEITVSEKHVFEKFQCKNNIFNTDTSLNQNYPDSVSFTKLKHTFSHFKWYITHWWKNPYTYRKLVNLVSCALWKIIQHHGQHGAGQLMLRKQHPAKVPIFLPSLELTLLQGKCIDPKVCMHFLNRITPKWRVVFAHKVIPKMLEKRNKQKKLPVFFNGKSRHKVNKMKSFAIYHVRNKFSHIKSYSLSA